MSRRKIAITLESGMLAEVDALVKKRMFSSRSRAIQEAVEEKLSRLNHNLLARECAKLDPEYVRVKTQMSNMSAFSAISSARSQGKISSICGRQSFTRSL